MADTTSARVRALATNNAAAMNPRSVAGPDAAKGLSDDTALYLVAGPLESHGGGIRSFHGELVRSIENDRGGGS